jgi:hypothetical protein
VTSQMQFRSHLQGGEVHSMHSPRPSPLVSQKQVGLGVPPPGQSVLRHWNELVSSHQPEGQKHHVKSQCARVVS